MAINIPIITSLEDTGIKNAKAAFNDFKTAVKNADTSMGKFKAGSTVALNAVKANSGTFALAAGTAIATFATKAVTAFQDLALASGKFSDATGLTVEEASKFIEVAGDINVPVDVLEGAIGRLNRTIGADPDLVKNLGVDLVYLNNGALDVNKTFLKTIERIKNIKDPAEKARVAAQLLGKGWQNMSELIQMGADDLAASLKSVSGAQIITDEELAKAKEYRETVDDLSDIWGSFVISAGGAVVDFAGDIKEMTSSWEGFGNQLRQGPAGRLLSSFAGLFNDNDEKAKAAEEAAKSLGDAYAGYVSSRLAESREEMLLMNLALEEQAELTEQADLKWQAYKNTLKLDRSIGNAKEQLKQLTEKAIEAFNGADGALSEYEQGLIDAKIMILELGESITLTNQQKNRIQVLVDTGQLEKALGLIDIISAGGHLAGVEEMRFRGRRAAGGPVMGGSTYLVGERGPELFTPASSGNITPNNALGDGGNTINVTITSADPNEVVRALQSYNRNVGKLPVSVQ